MLVLFWICGLCGPRIHECWFCFFVVGSVDHEFRNVGFVFLLWVVWTTNSGMLVLFFCFWFCGPGIYGCWLFVLVCGLFVLHLYDSRFFLMCLLCWFLLWCILDLLLS